MDNKTSSTDSGDLVIQEPENSTKSPTRRQGWLDSDSEDDRIILTLPPQASQNTPSNSPQRPTKSPSRISSKSPPKLSTSAAKPGAQKKQIRFRDRNYAQRKEIQTSGSQMRNASRSNAPRLLTRKPTPQLKPAAVPKSAGKDLKANDAVNVAASYKPPKLYQPKNWCTVRLYDFLETKMLNKYYFEARIRSENIIKKMIKTYTEVRKKKTSPQEKWKLVRSLMRVLAEHDVVVINMDFYYFCGDYLPYEYRCVERYGQALSLAVVQQPKQAAVST